MAHHATAKKLTKTAGKMTGRETRKWRLRPQGLCDAAKLNNSVHAVGQHIGDSQKFVHFD